MGGTIDTYGFSPELRLVRTPGIQERLLRGGIDLGLDNEALYQAVSTGLERYKEWSLANEEELSPAKVWCDYILPEYSVDQTVLAAAAEELMCYIETSYFERNLRPEVPGVLEAIKKMGYKIGLISNVNSRGQVPTNLREYQIIDYFNPIVLSSEFGRRKPDPAIFHYAASQACVPTSRCLFVGDQISRDILGAHRAGFQLGVQINHQTLTEPQTSLAVPDYIIADMTELLDILKTVSNRGAMEISPAVPQPDRVKALLFDAGDVLYYRSEKERYFRQYLKGLNLEPNDDLVAEKYTLRQQAYRGEITQKEYHTSILNAYGINQQNQLELGLAAIKQDEENVEFFKGARETLVELKEQGYLLGIVTDTANPIHVKLKWFERGGFGHVWDSITSSMDIGVRKPDPKIFQAALDQLGVSAGETLFLGHKTSELEGARSGGMKTIAFNYEPGAQADYYIEELPDLLDLPIIMNLVNSVRG